MPKTKKTIKKNTVVRIEKKQFPEQQIRTILEKVYLAGWKKDKSPVINYPNQLSVEQALEEIRKL
jgi:hypothetical protein